MSCKFWYCLGRCCPKMNVGLCTSFLEDLVEKGGNMVICFNLNPSCGITRISTSSKPLGVVPSYKATSSGCSPHPQ